MSYNPKYSLPEIERRWLVDMTKTESLEHSRVRHIEDRYINGTRLRLRCTEEKGKKPEYKLCKKYGKTDTCSEPITNLYLEENEYKNLAQLPAAVVDKLRYSLADGSIDSYAPEGIFVYEMEFNSIEQANSYEPPPFVLREITDVEGYSGYSIAMARS